MRTLFRAVVPAVFCLLVVSFGSTASASTIYIDFGGQSPLSPPSSAFGAAAAPGAWNGVSTLGATSGLKDANGTVTSVSVSVQVQTMSGNAGSSFPTDSDGARLVNDNFYSQAGSWSVTFSGLTAGFYDVYLYDPSNGTVGTGAGTVTGAGSSSTFGNINGGYPTPDFVSGFNYHLLAGIWVSGEGTLTAFGSSGLYSGLSGIQLVPNQVPERGGTLSMLALGLLFLFGGGRLRP